MPKHGLGIDVLTAAQQRIAWVFDQFPRVYVSFSGGKDSTVLLHLTTAEARKRGRKIGLLLVDLEAQYRLTIEHAEHCYALYSDCVIPFWVSLPIILRNAVSAFEPRWLCWDPERHTDWVRQPPPLAITDPKTFPFFRQGMEFEEFVPAFGEWFAEGKATACLVGIRSDESLNRYRTLVMHKTRREGRAWTTWVRETLYNAYPIYDWRTEDVWTFQGRTGLPWNQLYDRMQRAGLSIHQQRICQPYGDDQRKGLWLYQIIEPETWGRVVARVNGANGGALYAQEGGNILGRLKITLPAGHTWKSFSLLLLETMPPRLREHYRNKIAVFLQWWKARGYDRIPDAASVNEEAAHETPSWRRICKALLRHDYWCKGLSFTQTKSESYQRYVKVMKTRRQRWGIWA